MPASFPSRPSSNPTKQALSPDQQRLLLLFQRIRFGRVYRLVVSGGQPVVRHLHWKRTVRISGNNRPHPGGNRSDFHLKEEICQFFALIAAMGDGEIMNVEVWDGLPRSFEIEESLAD